MCVPGKVGSRIGRKRRRRMGNKKVGAVVGRKPLVPESPQALPLQSEFVWLNEPLQDSLLTGTSVRLRVHTCTASAPALTTCLSRCCLCVLYIFLCVLVLSWISFHLNFAISIETSSSLNILNYLTSSSFFEESSKNI